MRLGKLCAQVDKATADKAANTSERLVEEINGILTVLGDLPAKTGVWPLIVKIKEQAEPQVPAPPEAQN